MNCPALAFSTQKNVTGRRSRIVRSGNSANLHQRSGIHAGPVDRHPLAALHVADCKAVVELGRRRDCDLGVERADQLAPGNRPAARRGDGERSRLQKSAGWSRAGRRLRRRRRAQQRGIVIASIVHRTGPGGALHRDGSRIQVDVRGQNRRAIQNGIVRVPAPHRARARCRDLAHRHAQQFAKREVGENGAGLVVARDEAGVRPGHQFDVGPEQVQRSPAGFCCCAAPPGYRMHSVRRHPNMRRPMRIPTWW